MFFHGIATILFAFHRLLDYEIHIISKADQPNTVAACSNRLHFSIESNKHIHKTNIRQHSFWKYNIIIDKSQFGDGVS